MIENKLCVYGCGQKAIHQFDNGKVCCSTDHRSCPENRKKYKNIGMTGKKHSSQTKKKIAEKRLGKDPWNKGLKNCHSDEVRKVISEKGKGKTPWNKGKIGYQYGIEYYKNRYPTFFKIEEMRYDPDNIDIKKIQVRCKNHNCINSKERNGWFTPNRRQIEYRIQSIEQPYVNDS